MAKPKNLDWFAIESDYRTGVMSLRALGEKHGLSEGAIRKAARENGWQKDLAGNVAASTRNKLVRESAAAKLNMPVKEVAKKTDAEIIDSAAETQKGIVLIHRAEIKRLRNLVTRMAEEMEAISIERELFDNLQFLMANADESGVDKLGEAYKKLVQLPNRIKGVRDLAETLKSLVALEREAYGIQTLEQSIESDKLRNVTDNEAARRVAWLLTSALRKP